MKKNVSGKIAAIFLFAAACLVISIWGCRAGKAPARAEKIGPAATVTKIVVMGYREALPRGGQPGSVRDPSSGTVFMAEAVPPEAVRKMTFILFDSLAEDKRYELVSPGQAMGVYSRIVDSDSDVGIDSRKLLQKVGKTFGADAVLSGFIYRWREREGTEFGVKRSASVAFDLQLTRPEDGAVVWRRKFDKTQKSLTENILDISTFVDGRGRWMTAEELAQLGLRVILADMPGGIKRPDKESKPKSKGSEKE
ncbi:hypothetical protein ACFL2O_08490 [Thermodesulfobacteriota bacterium]